MCGYPLRCFICLLFACSTLSADGPVQEMELGSYPDLECIPDELASISDCVGSALKGASAPLSSSMRDTSSSSAESNKVLRRLLLKQMPSVEVRTRLRRLVEHVGLGLAGWHLLPGIRMGQPAGRHLLCKAAQEPSDHCAYAGGPLGC